MINLAAAWIGFLPGHISFFGIGFLNLGMGLTSNALGIASPAASILMPVGAVAMPAVCYASAFRPAFRHLFFIPAGSVPISIVLFLVSVDGASSSVLEEQRDTVSPLHSLNTQPVSFNPMEQEAPSTLTRRMVQS